MAERAVSTGGVLCDMTEYPEHLKLIGMVVTRFSSLEGELSICMWELMESPDLGTYVFAAINSTSGKLEVLRSLARNTTEGEIQRELLSTIKMCSAISELRNEIAHGQWAKPSDPALAANPSLVNIRPKNANLPAANLVYTLDDLQEIVDGIATCQKKVSNITQILRASHQPLAYSLLAEDRAKDPRVNDFCKRFDADIERSIARRK
ncbi:hypothetical protein [Achromobacter insolitus]|uniref:hypothetical protein n=1 Tax=Achromobacter insolitus TaxID=217204 RepID=UPI000A68DAC1|nr:hypothetical protein [Achromobacter insolitus]